MSKIEAGNANRFGVLGGTELAAAEAVRGKVVDWIGVGRTATEVTQSHCAIWQTQLGLPREHFLPAVLMKGTQQRAMPLKDLQHEKVVNGISTDAQPND